MSVKQASTAAYEPEPSAACTTRLARALTFQIPIKMLFEEPAADAAVPRANQNKIGAGSVEGRRAPCSRSDDSDIAAAAAVLLAWHDVDPEFVVFTKVDKGWITLSGHVDWPFKKDAVEQDIRRLPGVTGVTNTIEVTADVAASARSDATLRKVSRDADHILVQEAE